MQMLAKEPTQGIWEREKKKSKEDRPKRQCIADKQVETAERQRRIKKAKGWAQNKQEQMSG